MKKILFAAALFSLIAVPLRPEGISTTVVLGHRAASEATDASRSTLSNLTIPAETEVKAELLSGVQTEISHLDDPVVAQLTEAVYVNGHVALPRGTLFDGRITRLRAAGRYGHSAQLSFRFQTVTLPNGDSKQVTAVLASLDDSRGVGAQVDSEGQLRALKPSLWKRLSGGFVGAGGFVLAKVAFASSLGLAVGAPAGGAAWLGYEFLWRRGRQINLPPNTGCRIRLLDPLVVTTI